MGMIDRFLGVSQGVTALGSAATGMAEVFTRSATREMELDHQARDRATGQFAQEFVSVHAGLFDSFVNGLNRLPRPVMALGTMALFVYAMVEPGGFGVRMQGLQQVPEPLWWLLGAIVGFYFGAREAYHFRNRPATRQGPVPGHAAAPPDGDFADNAALQDWAAGLRA